MDDRHRATLGKEAPMITIIVMMAVVGWFVVMATSIHTDR